MKELSANTGDKEVHDIDKLDSGITAHGILEVMQDGMDLSEVLIICRGKRCLCISVSDPKI